MKTSLVASIRKHFVNLQDPWTNRRRFHHFMDIVVIANCAVIADCDNLQEIGPLRSKALGLVATIFGVASRHSLARHARTGV
jgi:hypothetical protein